MMIRQRPLVHVFETTALLVLLLDQTDVVLSQNRTLRVPDEQKLYERIMGGYVKWVRPILNCSQPIKVKFAMRLNQIVSLDERQQVLTTNVFIDQTWTDPALAWDPTEFKDVRALRIPADQVWRPDTFIYNNADNGSTGFIDGTYIQIRHTGAVSWPVPVRLRSSCVVKITYFPFDRQYCMVRFGSWIYSQSHVDYEVRQDVSSVDMSSFTKNSEWELLAMRLEKSVVSRTRGNGLHPHLTAVIYLKRNTFFYLFNIIVPCCMLSILTLMTFWLPPTSCEKVTLGLNVFLAFSMFMLLIAEEVPASSDAVPLIGIYLCVVMTMTSMSVLCAVLVTNLHNRGSKLKAAPRWLARLLIHYLAGPMRVSKDVKLLASTIYLPEHSQFFFLHDDRWNSKNQRAREDSDASSDEGTPWSSNPQVAVQSDGGRRKRTEKEGLSKNEVRPQLMTSDMNSVGQRTNHRTNSSLLPEADQGRLGYGWTGSWERVTNDELVHDVKECGESGFNLMKEKKDYMSDPRELMQLRDTAKSRIQRSDRSNPPDGQHISAEPFIDFTHPQRFSVEFGSKSTSKPTLYQETSLCGSDSSVMKHQNTSQVSRQGMTNRTQASPSTSYEHHSLNGSHIKSPLKPAQGCLNMNSPVESDCEGKFHQLLPIINEGYGGDSLSCEATLNTVSTSFDDDDAESEVWVLRDEFKKPNSKATAAENALISTNKQQASSITASFVPQHPPFLEHPTSSAPMQVTSPPICKVLSPRKRSCVKPSHPFEERGQNAQRVLKRARIMIAEWCIIAKVMDRILFILCLFATLFAYIFILIVVPIEFGTRSGNVTFVNTVNTGRYIWQQS